MSDETDAQPRSKRQHSVIDSLPLELSRRRVLCTIDACTFTGVSVAEWRRLNQAPPPIMIGSRKQGWRIGDLIDWIESRAQREPARGPAP
jgi:predicted DNA-binding transcriptional regulator AlpA